MKRGGPMRKLVELVAAQNRLLERVVLALEHAPSTSREYSAKPSAIRMRRLKGYGEFAASTSVTSGDARPSEKRRQQASTQVTRRLVVAADLDPQRINGKKSYGGRTIWPGVYRALYFHFAKAHQNATGRAWYAVGAVPGKEQGNATELLRVTGSLETAKAAIDRFGRLWRENAWTRHNLGSGFSLASVVCTLEHIGEKKHRLHLVSKTLGLPSRWRSKAPEPPAPAPPPIRRITTPGAATVGDILGQLRARRIVPR